MKFINIRELSTGTSLLGVLRRPGPIALPRPGQIHPGLSVTHEEIPSPVRSCLAGRVGRLYLGRRHGSLRCVSGASPQAPPLKRITAFWRGHPADRRSFMQRLRGELVFDPFYYAIDPSPFPIKHHLDPVDISSYRGPTIRSLDHALYYLNLASSLRHGVTTHSGRSWRGNLFTRCRCGTRQLAETVTTSPSLDP